jgi:hypothetical protein
MKISPHLSLSLERERGGVRVLAYFLFVKKAPGRYEYKFYLDGNWFEGSTGAEQISNSFGTQNFVLEIR